jgi:cyclopropane-fatty-acyl-phospholipid synthase
MSSSETRPGPGASPDAIQYHYDLSNEFYALWLDRNMNYSAAMFEPGDDLESAQIRKLDYHIEQARAAGKERVLDVGCGWGAMLKRCVQKHGVKQGVGLTLSDAQAQRIRQEAVPGLNVRVESWRDHKPEEPYDAIISVGAFEHFVHRNLSRAEKIAIYREFFAFCHESLRPGSWLSLQTISYGTLRAGGMDPFIEDAIFPESDLPYPWEILEAADGYFELNRMRNDRRDYRRTTREWYRNLAEHRARAVELLGEAKVEHYERYLRISIGSFQMRALGLLRLSFERLGR